MPLSMPEDPAERTGLRPPPLARRRITQLGTVSSPRRLRLLLLLAEGFALERVKRASERSPEDIEEDLEELRAAGLVEDHTVRQRDVDRAFVPDLTQLHELGEALRGLSIAYGQSPGRPDTPPTWPPAPSDPPSLTVVHGTTLGRSFPLETDGSPSRRGWIIGRGDDVDVPLEEDPYVGPEAGEIVPREGRFELVDLRSSDRRVSLNGQPLDRGERRELSTGDLVGVGRSLLRFEA